MRTINFYFGIYVRTSIAFYSLCLCVHFSIVLKTEGYMSKDNRLFIRVNSEEKKLIEDGAKHKNLTVSEFTLTAVLDRAKRILISKLPFRQ